MNKMLPNFCDQCGKKVIDLKSNFCSNCGADLTKMPVSYGSQNQKKLSSVIKQYKTILEEQLKSLLEDKNLDKETKINRMIHLTGVICGVISLQPIPIADILILTPIQIVMVLYIGKAMGFEISFSRATGILTEILGVIGLGMLSQNLVLLAYKTIIPYFGGTFTLPFVWAATFGIGTVAKEYYKLKKGMKKLTSEEDKRLKKEFRENFVEKIKMPKEEIKKIVEDSLKQLKIK
ncbi:MAG: hypothetical protein SNJ64_06290 [Endomicrobiia bacterium]